MPKPTTLFRCDKCDAQFPKWQGRCPECGAWGSIAQQELAAKQAKRSKPLGAPATVVSLNAIAHDHVKRIPTGIAEIDRVLGGGIVPGGVYLVGGDPGVGKSTLLLHVADSVKLPTVYFSGEESADQVKTRVDRLGVALASMGFAAETDCSTILSTIEAQHPALVIIDSLQTLRDATLEQEAGSVTQLKAVTAQLVEQAKQSGCAMFIVSHVTKSGKVSGPKTVEHLVDAVLYVEGDQYHNHRIVRSVKNRFGSVDEIGVFTIDEKGFHEAVNPSQAFLSEHSRQVPGTVITPVVEGSRVFFVEYQALVSRTHFGYPVRKSVGFDQNRLQMLLAVLVKRLKLPLDQYDVHLNVAGGLRLQEPACDLAAVVAVVSAFKNIAIPKSAAVFGEVGLGGEVRPVAFSEKRVKEAKKLGYTAIVCPQMDGVGQMQAVATIQDSLLALGMR